MRLMAIANILVGEVTIGFRLLDTANLKARDYQIQKVENMLKSGLVNIENLKIENTKIIGSNGSIDRLTKIINNEIVGKSPLIIIKQLGESKFLVSDYKGSTVVLQETEVIRYANENGISNGKVITKGEKQYISAISGRYIKDKDPDITTRILVGKTTKERLEKLLKVVENIKVIYIAEFTKDKTISDVFVYELPEKWMETENWEEEIQHLLDDGIYIGYKTQISECYNYIAEYVSLYAKRELDNGMEMIKEQGIGYPQLNQVLSGKLKDLIMASNNCTCYRIAVSDNKISKGIFNKFTYVKVLDTIELSNGVSNQYISIISVNGTKMNEGLKEISEFTTQIEEIKTKSADDALKGLYETAYCLAFESLQKNQLPLKVSANKLLNHSQKNIDNYIKLLEILSKYSLYFKNQQGGIGFTTKNHGTFRLYTKRTIFEGMLYGDKGITYIFEQQTRYNHNILFSKGINEKLSDKIKESVIQQLILMAIDKLYEAGCEVTKTYKVDHEENRIPW